MVRAVDDHAYESERPPRADQEAVAALNWTRTFVASRQDTLERTPLSEVLAAARDENLDEDHVRRALAALGFKSRRNGLLRRRHGSSEEAGGIGGPRPRTERRSHRRESERAPRTRRDEPPPVPAAVPRSKRVLDAKVHIASVELVNDSDAPQPSQPAAIVVTVHCELTGRLDARILVRGEEHVELEAVAPCRDVHEPGEFTLRCDIPASALDDVRHAVDVEAWLDAGTARYATMQTSVERFKSRPHGRGGSFVRVDAVWADEPS